MGKIQHIIRLISPHFKIKRMKEKKIINVAVLIAEVTELL